MAAESSSEGFTEVACPLRSLTRECPGIRLTRSVADRDSACRLTEPAQLSLRNRRRPLPAIGLLLVVA